MLCVYIYGKLNGMRWDFDLYEEEVGGGGEEKKQRKRKEIENVNIPCSV